MNLSGKSGGESAVSAFDITGRGSGYLAVRDMLDGSPADFIKAKKDRFVFMNEIHEWNSDVEKISKTFESFCQWI